MKHPSRPKMEGRRKMFSFLFGKKETKIAGAIANPIGDLRQREEDLEKKIRQLERLKESHRANAISQKAAGANASAIHFLKREKLAEDELASANNMLLMIIQQRSALEAAMMNNETLTVVSRAAHVIKNRQAEWSVDAVSNLVDEMQDAKDTIGEISDLIRSAAGATAADEELLRQLDLEQPSTEKLLASLPLVPQAAPLVPQATNETPESPPSRQVASPSVASVYA